MNKIKFKLTCVATEIGFVQQHTEVMQVPLQYFYIIKQVDVDIHMQVAQEAAECLKQRVRNLAPDPLYARLLPGFRLASSGFSRELTAISGSKTCSWGPTAMPFCMSPLQHP